MAPLLAADGHDGCPTCLGVVHLRQGLSDSQCMNCSFMPHGLKVARLAEVERSQLEGELPRLVWLQRYRDLGVPHLGKRPRKLTVCQPKLKH